MGFLLDETPVQDLPLLVEFEAKSIAKKYPAAKAHMEKRYIFCFMDITLPPSNVDSCFVSVFLLSGVML